jgi:hypothetical protein
MMADSDSGSIADSVPIDGGQDSDVSRTAVRQARAGVPQSLYQAVDLHGQLESPSWRLEPPKTHADSICHTPPVKFPLGE